MRIPETCQMPDLTLLDSLIPGFSNAVTFFNGDELTQKEKLYIRVFVRLVNKALTESELIKFDDLAGVLKRFHEVALQWIDIFCKKT